METKTINEKTGDQKIRELIVACRDLEDFAEIQAESIIAILQHMPRNFFSQWREVEQVDEIPEFISGRISRNRALDKYVNLLGGLEKYARVVTGTMGELHTEMQVEAYLPKDVDRATSDDRIIVCRFIVEKSILRRTKKAEWGTFYSFNSAGHYSGEGDSLFDVLYMGPDMGPDPIEERIVAQIHYLQKTFPDFREKIEQNIIERSEDAFGKEWKGVIWWFLYYFKSSMAANRRQDALKDELWKYRLTLRDLPEKFRRTKDAGIHSKTIAGMREQIEELLNRPQPDEIIRGVSF